MVLSKTHWLWLFCLLLGCAGLIRLIALSSIPFGFHVDEVKVGWNAYSILKIGRDDWGNALALHYNTFGDWRPSGIFYLTIPSIWLFGLSVFAVRLPGALFGIAVVAVTMLIVWELVKDKRVVFLSGFFAAFSPWEVVISRATSEVMMAAFFMLGGIYLLIRSTKNQNKAYLIGSVFVFLPAYFLYHTARVLVPLFVIFGFMTLIRKKVKREFLVSASIALFILITLSGLFALNKDALQRYSQVSIPNNPAIQQFQSQMPTEEGMNKVLITRLFHNKFIIYTTTALNNYLSYLSPDFFVSPGVAKPTRYQTVNNGIITYIELVLAILGIGAVIRKKYPSLPLVLLLLAPLPSALTTEDTPNLHRAFIMSPFVCILAGYGAAYILSIKRWGKTLFILSLLLFFANFIYFWHMYSIHNPKHSPMFISRNDGALSLASYLGKHAKEYSLVYVTAYPDEFYPWYAFVTKPDPAVFNKLVASRGRVPWQRVSFRYKNIVFTQIKCPSDYFASHPRGKILAVDGEGCIPQTFAGLTLKQVGQISRLGPGYPYTLETFVTTSTQSAARHI